MSLTRRVKKPGILKVLLCWLILLLIPCFSFGQPSRHKVYQNAVIIRTINDNFLPPIQDEYYTNGLSLGYAHLLKKSLFGGRGSRRQAKSILSFRLQQDIFTPSSLLEENVNKLDRPYASTLYLKTSVNTLWNYRNNFSLGLMLGVIGPNAGGEKIQIWWHKMFNFETPEGWKYQINNTAIVNLNAAYRHSWMLSHHADVISKSAAALGTAFDNISSGFLMRLGKINAINNSALTQSRMSRNEGAELNYIKEWFFVFGFENTVDFHNTTIEGEIFHPERSSHTEQAKPYYLTLTGGFAYSSPLFTWKLMMHQLTTKVAGAAPHNYVSLKLAFRF